MHKLLENNILRCAIDYKSRHIWSPNVTKKLSKTRRHNVPTHWHTDVWKMLQEASFISEIQKTNTNQLIIMSFFRITHFLVKQNWANTNNFKNLVDLIRECGRKELQTHLLTVFKNSLCRKVYWRYEWVHQDTVFCIIMYGKVYAA